MKFFVIILGLLISMHAVAQQDRYQFDTNEQALRFEELSKELRCPKCQNQNIADSDAVVAKDLRDRVVALVKEGKSKKEVINHMIDRYGYFVHYDPPVTPATLVLWVLPGVILVIGFGFIVFRQRRASIKQTWSDTDEVRLSKLIEKNKRQEQS